MSEEEQKEQTKEKLPDRLYRYYMNRIIRIMKKAARSAKTHEELCQELLLLRSTISGLGGSQLSTEQKNALKGMINDALKRAGCL